jgi:hypothetical protein
MATDIWASDNQAVSRGGGCPAGHATLANCQEILDRIVEIELAEQRFADPALTARKQRHLRRLLAPDLKRCEGRPLPLGALACLRGARTTEEISHTCLR